MDEPTGIARWVCGRRTKWIVLLVWLAATMMVAGPLAQKITGVQKNDIAQWLPGKAEATQVVALQKKFQPDTLAAVVVYERTAGISAADQAKATADATALTGIEGVVGPVTGPVASHDGRALQVTAQIKMGGDGFNKISKRIDAVRKVTGAGGSGLSVKVAGPAGYDADSVKAFSGVGSTLLPVTMLVVMIILLLTYRSPLLWLLPILCAGTALTTSQAVIYLLAKNSGLTVQAQSAGILTVLVFGAGTDYALLLVSRYREELHRHEDRHQAMAIALRRVTPAIVASAATVAVALLCLTAARMNNTRGLGPVLAIGILVGLITMITLMPALLVIFGRWIFWPKRPKAGSPVKATDRWARLGTRISRRPRTVWIATAIVLAALATGMTQLHADGLTAKDSLTGTPESIAGQDVLARHFPAGQDGQPVVAIGNAAAAPAIQQALAGTRGITAVSRPVVHDGLAYMEGTLNVGPDTAAAHQVVINARSALHAIPGANAKVGGQTALTMDMNSANRHDNTIVIPLALVAVLLVLGLLLRAVVAPLLLMATVVLSFGAALGLSALLFQHVFGFHGTDSNFPLFAFVFLVALGIDYNIFLMSRVREEAQRHGTRTGMLNGLAATGGVITSAGIVLAGTFSVFASIPVVDFVELGVAVALGVLLDTFVVRSVLVTALTLDIGRGIWAPGRLAARPDTEAGDPTGREPVTVS